MYTKKYKLLHHKISLSSSYFYTINLGPKNLLTPLDIEGQVRSQGAINLKAKTNFIDCML